MGRLFHFEFLVFAAISAFILPAACIAAEPLKPADPGLPVPRFASLKSDDVDMRVGPGKRYKVQWVYKRKELPVEILRDFDNWRLVRDADGEKGWMHTATLTGKRTFVVTAGEQLLRNDASDGAAGIARLELGVIGEIKSCAATATWCRVKTKDYEGWIARTAIWGIEPGEAIGQ